MQPIARQLPQSKTYRAVTFAVGALFVALAITVFVVSGLSFATLIAGVLLGGLGLDAMIGAFRNKRSLLAKIGPLP